LVSVVVEMAVVKLVETVFEYAVDVAVEAVEEIETETLTDVTVTVLVAVGGAGLSPPWSFLPRSTLRLCCAPANRPMNTEETRRNTSARTRSTLVNGLRGSCKVAATLWAKEGLCSCMWPFCSDSGSLSSGAFSRFEEDLGSLSAISTAKNDLNAQNAKTQRWWGFL